MERGEGPVPSHAWRPSYINDTTYVYKMSNDNTTADKLFIHISDEETSVRRRSLPSLVLMDYFSHTAHGVVMDPNDTTLPSWRVLYEAYRSLLITQYIPPDNMDKCLWSKRLDQFVKRNVPTHILQEINNYGINITSDHIVLPGVVRCKRCSSTANLKRCPRCNLVAYCSSECMDADAEAHAQNCLREFGGRNVCPSCFTCPYKRPSHVDICCPLCLRPVCVNCAEEQWGPDYKDTMIHHVCLSESSAIR